MTTNKPLFQTNKPLSVLLIEQKMNHHSALKKALLDTHFTLAKHLSATDDIRAQVKSCQPTMLMLAMDLPCDKILKDLAKINQLLPLPMIIFAKNDCPYTIQRGIKAVVSAYIVDDVLPKRLNSIITVANERFKAVQLLRSELQHTKAQLAGRKYIEKAKGYIMQQKNITEHQAYGDLRKMAMDQGSPLATVAKNIIDVCELLSGTHV